MANLYACNTQHPTDHCREHCLHGVPHTADECTCVEECMVNIEQVACKRVGQRELARYQEVKNAFSV